MWTSVIASGSCLPTLHRCLDSPQGNTHTDGFRDEGFVDSQKRLRADDAYVSSVRG